MRDGTGVRANIPSVETFCVECGRPFMAYRRGVLVCSYACNMRRWRAYTMLRGTHGFVKGRFQRLAVDTT
jgi:hypothetical protein